jgi:hypothetical protein
MRGIGLERAIAEFVNDRQLWLGEEREPLLGMRLRRVVLEDQPY